MDASPENTPNTATLWRDYSGKLRAFINKRVHNSADAEDLLQEIMAKAILKSDTADPANLKAWLFTVARNTIMDFYRQKQRRLELDSKDLWYEELETESLLELQECVAPFIQALPPEQRQLLTKIDLENLPQKAVALDLGIPYSTLKSRVQKARKMLRHLYEQCCSFSFDPQGRLIEFQQKDSPCRHC